MLDSLEHIAVDFYGEWDYGTEYLKIINTQVIGTTP